MSKDNIILMTKLDEIYSRHADRPEILPKQDSIGSNSRSYNSTFQTKKGSLNYNRRMREYQRIDEENARMMSKLEHSKPMLQKKQFDQHFVRHKRYM